MRNIVPRKMPTTSRQRLALAGAALALTVAACGDATDRSGPTAGGLTGRIAIDGPRGTYPFAQAAAEQFQTDNPDVTITVGRSGADAGFARLCSGEVDVAEASELTEPRCDGGRSAPTAFRPTPEPLVLYASNKSFERPEVKAFIQFVRAHAEEIARAARIR
jgi:DNA-binding transcriptional LysR family regulator